MNRKIELAKKKQAEKDSERLLIEKHIASQDSLRASIDSLYELMNGKEEYDFSKLEHQLSELDKRLDFAPFFKSLENSIKSNKTTQHKKIKIEGFSELLKAVNDNKPLPVKVDLKAFEKSIVNIEQYIKEQTRSSDQGAEDYLPVRRVIKMGNRLVFDDNVTNPGGGGGANINTTGLATSANQDTIIDNLETLNSLIPSIWDYASLSYTGDNLTGVVFKNGGSGGTTVSTLTLGYTGSNLTSVTKT